MPRCVAGLLALALLAPAAAPAQDAQPLRPGDPTVRGDRIRAGASTATMVLVRDGAEQPVGTATDQVSRVEHGGRTVLLRVQTVRRGPALLVDSTASDPVTLAPLWHRSRQPRRTLDFRFGEDGVAGRVVPADGPPTEVATALPELRFDAGNWDLVARALPLVEGYAAWIPVYDPDRAAEAVRYKVRVAGREPVDGVQAWRLDARVGESDVRLWVDEATRRVRRLEVDVAPGTTLVQVPLHGVAEEPAGA